MYTYAGMKCAYRFWKECIIYWGNWINTYNTVVAASLTSLTKRQKFDDVHVYTCVRCWRPMWIRVCVYARVCVRASLCKYLFKCARVHSVWICSCRFPCIHTCARVCAASVLCIAYVSVRLPSPVLFPFFIHVGLNPFPSFACFPGSRFLALSVSYFLKLRVDQNSI